MNYGESASVVHEYVTDTGLRETVLLDTPGLDGTCFTVPEDAESLYEHMTERVGDPMDGPFPLHVLIDADGIIRYASKFHRPKAVLEALSAL